jgi:hypothetical protein
MQSLVAIASRICARNAVRVLDFGSEINKSDVGEIVKAFPRRFKAAFVKTCADVIRKHPQAASSSFMRDIRERYVPEFHSRNFAIASRRLPSRNSG